MQFLITNDDGIDAPGIAAMAETIRLYAKRKGWPSTKIWVVAPDRGRSECGHSVTTSRDLKVARVRPGWYAIDGTPVDCVRVAMACLCPQVDGVFSGINAGANLGIDLLVSGTFAAAREASILGKPAMAISHYRHPEIPKTWQHAPEWLEHTLDRFFASDHQSPAVWNVNLPAIDPIQCPPPATVECPVDVHPMPRTATLTDQTTPAMRANRPKTEQLASQKSTEWSVDNRGATVQLRSDFHGRPRQTGSDVDLCFAGNLTISHVRPYPETSSQASPLNNSVDGNHLDPSFQNRILHQPKS